MSYQEKIEKVKEKMKNKDYKTAEQELLQIIKDEEVKSVEDEQNIYYTFYDYIETLIFYNKYRPTKKLIRISTNIADVYFMLGYINFEMKNFSKAIEYLNKASEWNPVSSQIIFEKANAYRNMGEIERFRVEIEKSYQYIYTSSSMAKYYRGLGWYYSEKRLFDVANALYTRSKSFSDTEIANNELIYIAQQEKREPRISTIEEIKEIFIKYNIPIGIRSDLTQMIYEESQYFLKEKKNMQLVNFLYRTLYDITLDTKFMLYNNLKDEKTGIMIKIPEIWRNIHKEDYSKFNIEDNILFLFLTPKNERISVVCDGKCKPNQLDIAYNLNIENMKRQGASIEAEYAIKEQKNIRQVFVLYKQNEENIRIYKNYLVVNGYIINVSWEVPNNVPLEKIREIENNSLKSQFVQSIKGEKDDNFGKDAMNENNERLGEIKEEFKTNGITPKIVNLLKALSSQIIKDEIDSFWSDSAKHMLNLLILSNLMENKEFILSDLFEQTENVELVRNLINSKIDKLDIPELKELMVVKQLISSDKPFKSIVEIIHKDTIL